MLYTCQTPCSTRSSPVSVSISLFRGDGVGEGCVLTTYILVGLHEKDEIFSVMIQDETYQGSNKESLESCFFLQEKESQKMSHIIERLEICPTLKQIFSLRSDREEYFHDYFCIFKRVQSGVLEQIGDYIDFIISITNGPKLLNVTRIWYVTRNILIRVNCEDY